MIAALTALALAAGCPTKVPRAGVGSVDAVVGAKIERVCVVGAGADLQLAERLQARAGAALSLETVSEDLGALVASFSVRDARAVALPTAKKAVTLVYAVDEFERLDAVTVSGNHELTSADLTKELRVGFPLSPARPRQIAAHARESLTLLGYANATVDYRIEPAGKPGHVKLAFDVSEGSKQVIEAVRFVGAKLVEEAELRRAIMGTIGSVYTAQLAERDTAALSVVLYEHGLVTGTVAPSVNDSELVFTLQEGPLYRIGKVDVTGWTFGASPLAALETQPKEPFCRSSVATDLDRLKARARQSGAAIDVNPAVNVDSDKHVVDITFEVTKLPNKSIEF